MIKSNQKVFLGESPIEKHCHNRSRSRGTYYRRFFDYLISLKLHCTFYYNVENELEASIDRSFAKMKDEDLT